MKHTPAPWIFNETDLTIRSKSWGTSNQMGDYQGCIVCDLKSALSGPDCNVEDAERARAHAVPEMKSNARLIAAAPEMLAALERLLPFLNDQNNLLDNASLNEGRATEWDMASVQARRAIAKATQ